ncbi:MAG TPA: urease accessory UreF family protein [Propionibacteriaceae bacterium]|nr:urease accessory UreF family protein [Propionibacteriaceae bacterium]
MTQAGTDPRGPASAAYLRLLLADGRLPTGGHTQSGGVEPALLAGMAVDQVPDYLMVRLRTVTEVEAATSVLARHRWLASGSTARAAALTEVDAAWRARTVSDALRAASDLLGRSYARMARTLWSLDLGDDVVYCRAVVVGATAAAAGLGADDTARLVGYEDVQTVVAAALKIRPFDPAVALRWAAAAGADVEAMVTRVAGVCSIEQLPARSAPLVEAWGQAHVRTARRLYRA